MLYYSLVGKSLCDERRREKISYTTNQRTDEDKQSQSNNDECFRFASIQSIRQLNNGCHTVQFVIEYEEMYFNTVMQELL